MARLVQIEVLAGPDVGETREIREETILVGRGSTCQMQISSPHVSRQQCELNWQGDQLVLENLGTVNVTYLNDRPIERVYVQDGDLITFCDVALRVRIPRAGRPDAPPDPDRTVAFAKEQVATSAPPPAPSPTPGGHALPRPGSEATFIQQSAPRGQDTHPPGPLGGRPPGPPPGQLVSGGLGTGTYSPLASPPPAPPRSLPPGLPPEAFRSQAQMAPLPPGLPPEAFRSQAQMAPLPPGLPPEAFRSQAQMAPLPPGLPPDAYRAQAQGAGGRPAGMPSAPGMPSVGPGGPYAMHPGMPPGGVGGPNAARTGSPGLRSAAASVGAASVDRPRKKGKKRKGGAGPTNLPLIRNIVLGVAGIVVLLSFAYALSQPRGAKKGPQPTAITKAAEAEVAATDFVPVARGDRTDQEIVQEGQRLFGIGTTYLREYQIADENLWTAVEYMRRARAELAHVPVASWPEFGPELERKIAEAEGLLDQEFRRIKLGYVREKSAGNFDRAMAEMDRLQRIFPDKDDERHQFAKKQKQVLNKLMSGNKGGGVFGG